MKVAILGGGSAGFMAAAHLTHHFPEIDLAHVYDSRRPALGVGEGTTPLFPKWLHDVTGSSFAELERSCLITRKDGIRFENWGPRHREFMHRFHPFEDHAYHVSAARLIDHLRHHVDATRIDGHVVGVRRVGHQSRVYLDGGETIEAEMVLDARGFPSRLARRHKRIRWIPTDAAVVRRGPAGEARTYTRSVARPHGWIFVIPLTAYTSYGYVYSRDCSSREQVNDDFAAFLGENGLVAGELSNPRGFVFPNFTEREFFDGGVFRIGNRGSFLEPLEATALAVTLTQLELVSYWLLATRSPAAALAGQPGEGERRILNELLGDLVERLALFISWHYARGSAFDSPFWRHAQSCFETALAEIDGRRIGRDFRRFVDASATYPVEQLRPGSLGGKARPWTDWQTLEGSFGGCREPNFAEVGRGIDYFNSATTAAPEPRPSF